MRHAFSVRFLEQHPGEIEALQRLLGHSKIETTQRYWRAIERKRLMERVRDLSCDTRLESIAEKAPSGLEPLFSENADPERQALEHTAPSGSELNPFLARVLERVKQHEAEKAR